MDSYRRAGQDAQIGTKHDAAQNVCDADAKVEEEEREQGEEEETEAEAGEESSSGKAETDEDTEEEDKEEEVEKWHELVQRVTRKAVGEMLRAGVDEWVAAVKRIGHLQAIYPENLTADSPPRFWIAF